MRPRRWQVELDSDLSSPEPAFNNRRCSNAKSCSSRSNRLTSFIAAPPVAPSDPLDLPLRCMEGQCQLDRRHQRLRCRSWLFRSGRSAWPIPIPSCKLWFTRYRADVGSVSCSCSCSCKDPSNDLRYCLVSRPPAARRSRARYDRRLSLNSSAVLERAPEETPAAARCQPAVVAAAAAARPRHLSPHLPSPCPTL